MRLFAFTTSAMFAAALAAPANAKPLQYTLTGNDFDGTVEYASFQIDETPTPLPNNISVGDGFRIKFLTGTFKYGDIVNALRDVQFFSDTKGGGFFDLAPTDPDGSSNVINVLGPQLYYGVESKPTLLAGDFAVYDAYSGAPLSLHVAAVPETTTWVMTIAACGAIGATLRRRRATAPAMA